MAGLVMLLVSLAPLVSLSLGVEPTLLGSGPGLLRGTGSPSTPLAGVMFDGLCAWLLPCPQAAADANTANASALTTCFMLSPFALSRAQPKRGRACCQREADAAFA